MFFFKKKKKKNIVISVAKDFSRFPGVVFHLNDAARSAVAFRRMLTTALLSDKDVLVELDGTCGYSSSFLKEAFGGMINESFSSLELRRRMTVLSDKDPSLVEEIWSYVDPDNIALNSLENKK